MMNFELRHLRYFTAVAEELHFGRAAERLHISQPPLSQQIRALEDIIGAKLFERDNRNVRLTKTGEMFLKEACLVLNQAERASEKVLRMQQGLLGEVTIGFTSSAPFISPVSRALRSFRQLHPQVHITMREINSRPQIEPLLAGELDFGVMRNTPLPATLQHRLLLQEPLVAVVPEEHALSTLSPGTLSYRHLAEEPFVFFSREVGTALYDEILTRLAKAGIVPYITQEVGEAMTIIGLVSSGLGVSILPASFARLRIAGVRYITLTDTDATTEVWLVHRGTEHISAAASVLLNLMIEKE